MSFLQTHKKLRLTRALQSSTFSWFWLGQTISAFGDGAFMTALAVAVYALTGSSLMMGLFLTAQIIPELLLTLVGGMVADRFSRRIILLWADSGRALVVLLIAALIWLRLLQLWHLFALAILFGLARTFFHPAYRAITPELVEKEHLASASALTNLSLQLGSMLGPMLGALFIALSGGSASLALAFDGLTFVISAGSLLAIRSTRVSTQEKASEESKEERQAGARKVIGEMLEGFRTIAASTWLLWSMLSATFGLVAYTGAIVVSLPKLVFAVYGSSTWLLAALSTGVGLGSILGAIVVGQFPLRRRGMVAFMGYILTGLALAAFSIPLPASGVPFVVLPAAFLVGFGMNVMNTIWTALLYELVPGEKLGRVASVDLLGSLGLLPLGYVLAGWISDSLGPTAVFLLGGLLMALLNSFPLCLRAIRTLQ